MTRPACPRCGALDALPVVYGLPGPELQDAARRGEVALGHCCIAGDGSDPAFECRACGHRFRRLDDDEDQKLIPRDGDEDPIPPRLEEELADGLDPKDDGAPTR